MGRNRCCASDDARVRLADVAPVPGVAHRDVQVGDVRLHVAEAGSELHVPGLLAMGGASPLGRVLDPQPGPMLRVETIPEAGHFLPEEAPQAVAELAAPFLAGEGS